MLREGGGGVNFPSNFTVFSLHDDKFEVLIKFDKLSSNSGKTFLAL